jgi:hypothetical protein
MISKDLLAYNLQKNQNKEMSKIIKDKSKIHHHHKLINIKTRVIILSQMLNNKKERKNTMEKNYPLLMIQTLKPPYQKGLHLHNLLLILIFLA